jgi:hypothetical protein
MSSPSGTVNVIPDPIEAAESSAERWADDHIRGNDFKCCCGKWIPISEGVCISPNPYAPPVCIDCAGLS